MECTGLRHQNANNIGIKVEYQIPPSEKIKRLQKKLSRKKIGSKRYNEVLLQLQKEYEHLANEKVDIVNKVGSYLVNTFSLVSFQNDSVHSWSKRFGRKVQNTGIAKLKIVLSRHKNTYKIDRYYASTQACSSCHTLNRISLSQRVLCLQILWIDKNLNP